MPPKYKPQNKQPNLRDIVDELRIALENKLGKIDDKLTILTNDLLHIKDNYHLLRGQESIIQK